MGSSRDYGVSPLFTHHHEMISRALSWRSANAARSVVGPRVRQGNRNFATSQVLTPSPVILFAGSGDVNRLFFRLGLLLLLRLRLLSFYRQRSSCQEKNSYD
jgi:hypothetical protein